MNQTVCSHLQDLHSIKTSKSHVCEECIKTGSRWVHLRVCQTCGATLCCDDSPNRHMTQHYHTSGHPVVASAERGEKWLWCYVDEQIAEYS